METCELNLACDKNMAACTLKLLLEMMLTSTYGTAAEDDACEEVATGEW